MSLGLSIFPLQGWGEETMDLVSGIYHSDIIVVANEELDSYGNPKRRRITKVLRGSPQDISRLKNNLSFLFIEPILHFDRKVILHFDRHEKGFYHLGLYIKDTPDLKTIADFYHYQKFHQDLLSLISQFPPKLPRPEDTHYLLEGNPALCKKLSDNPFFSQLQGFKKSKKGFSFRGYLSQGMQKKLKRPARLDCSL